MGEPSWKRLVEDLHARGHESAYLDRLRARLPAAASMRELQAEILTEMASALGRAEDKINLALLRAELHGRTLDALEAAGERGERWQRALDAHETERAAAVRAIWELRVHREAIGFRRNERLAEIYPVPPSRRPSPAR